MTFAKRGNTKPFGKRLSPSAEMPNLSGNDFRQARKCQTLRETTFAKRGNAKPFGKRLSPSAEMSNHSGNDFCHARKCQTKGFNISTRRITIFFRRVLNNRPTLHLVCSVGRKTIKQNSLLIVLGYILCRNCHNLSVCIGYHYIFAFEGLFANHFLMCDFYTLHHFARKFAVSFFIFHNHLFLKIMFRYIQSSVHSFHLLPLWLVLIRCCRQSTIHLRLG